MQEIRELYFIDKVNKLRPRVTPINTSEEKSVQNSVRECYNYWRRKVGNKTQSENNRNKKLEGNNICRTEKCSVHCENKYIDENQNLNQEAANDELEEANINGEDGSSIKSFMEFLKEKVEFYIDFLPDLPQVKQRIVAVMRCRCPCWR